MKYLSYLLGAGLILLSSCNVFLEEDPQQSLAITEVYQTTDDLNNALQGAYNALQHSDFAGCNLVMVPEIVGDNGTWRGSFPSFVDIFNRQQTADNGEIQGAWAMGFRAINNANLILEAIGNVSDITPEDADRIRGECLFIRGYALFELTRTFGKPWSQSSNSDPGVPIMLAGIDDLSKVTFPTRNTVAECYAQAIADLEGAEGLLSETNRGYGYASQMAAKAVLASIYFQQRDYPNALTKATEIVNGPFSLVDNPQDFYGLANDNPEAIWSIIHTVNDNLGVNGSLPTFHNVLGRGGDVIVSQDLINNGYDVVLTDAQKQAAAANGDSLFDQRVTELTSDGGTPGTVGVNIEKYTDVVNNSDDAPIYRLAEFMLMQAECLARANGVDATAIDLLNQVRLRAIRALDAGGAAVDPTPYVAYTAGDFADAQALIDAIVVERRVEFCFEGKRKHDLQRLQLSVRGMAWDSDMLVWPIPQRELDANANIQQNPGY